MRQGTREVITGLAVVRNRTQAARLYAMYLQYATAKTGDWRTVNALIMARWSMAGLLWIKEQAWRIYERKGGDSGDP